MRRTRRTAGASTDRHLPARVGRIGECDPGVAETLRRKQDSISIFGSVRHTERVRRSFCNSRVTGAR
jgi:hypothetical protein